MGVNLTGRNLIRDLISGTSSSYVTHIAIGTGTTAFNDADTALETEVLRKAFETSTDSDSQTIYEMWISSTEANSNTLSEVGIFNASSSGTMLCRDTFTGIAKDNTKEVLIEVKVVISDES